MKNKIGEIIFAKMEDHNYLDKKGPTMLTWDQSGENMEHQYASIFNPIKIMISLIPEWFGDIHQCIRWSAEDLDHLIDQYALPEVMKRCVYR